jgi:hypothetical protein
MSPIGALTYVLAALVLTSHASPSSRRAARATAVTNVRGDTLSGLFILQLMNGKELPVNQEHNGLVYTLNSVSIAFKLNGTYDQSTSVTVTQAGRTFGPETYLVRGTFDYAASTHVVSLRGSSGLPMGGSIVNDMMTLQVVRDTAVFYRQN